VKPLSEAIVNRICAATGARAVERTERIQRLWSGYGELLRVWLSGADHASVIVKLVQPRAADVLNAAQRRSHTRKLRSYAVELCFYERYASRCGEDCRVARTLLCEQASDHWLFVLEDLDAAGFYERRHQLPQQALRACLTWLAQFHAKFMGEPAAGLWPVGTYWHLDTRPDELARSNDPQLRAAASQFDTQLQAARYRTLVHGDAKTENFCFTRDLGHVAAVDFQYVGGGIGVQDVAYFFSSCLDDRSCEQQAPALLDHYFAALQQALAAQHPNIDAAKLETEWRALYPVAWADFSRFMSGWAPEQNARSGYAGHMTTIALSNSDNAAL
jgi:glycine/D-amino acid oxidase-like deaminating enzyme